MRSAGVGIERNNALDQPQNVRQALLSASSIPDAIGIGLLRIEVPSIPHDVFFAAVVSKGGIKTMHVHERAFSLEKTKVPEKQPLPLLGLPGSKEWSLANERARLRDWGIHQ